jgi:hypothetical protein
MKNSGFSANKQPEPTRDKEKVEGPDGRLTRAGVVMLCVAAVLFGVGLLIEGSFSWIGLVLLGTAAGTSAVGELLWYVGRGRDRWRALRRRASGPRAAWELVRENWVMILGIIIIMAAINLAFKKMEKYGREERELREELEKSEKPVAPPDRAPPQ